MKKKLTTAIILLALACGFYAIANARGGAPVATETPTHSPSAPATATAITCEVVTGYADGAVNLRSCGGTSCDVVDILKDGESLKVLSAGNWTQAVNKRGVKGWLNSTFCREATK